METRKKKKKTTTTWMNGVSYLLILPFRYQEEGIYTWLHDWMNERMTDWLTWLELNGFEWQHCC